MYTDTLNIKQNNSVIYFSEFAHLMFCIGYNIIGCHYFTIALKCSIAFNLCHKNCILVCIVPQWLITFMNSQLLCALDTQYYGVPLIYCNPDFSLLPQCLVMFCNETFTLEHTESNQCWVDSKKALLHGHYRQFFMHSSLSLGHFILLCILFEKWNNWIPYSQN